MVFEVSLQRPDIFLESFHLCLFIVDAGYGWRNRGFPVVNVDPVCPRGMRGAESLRCISPTELAAVAPTATHTEGISAVKFTGRIVIGD